MTEYLVIDVEATCWADQPSSPSGKTIVDKVSEIIEIGYARYDGKSNQILSHGSIIVKPEHSEVSPFCTKLTSITQEMVDKGVSFKEACDILVKDLNSKGTPWASFGAYDREMFVMECKRKGVEYPFTVQHLNVKQQAGSLLGKVQGLGGTLTKLGLNFVGTHHRGGDDAHNTARIMQKFAEIVRTRCQK